MKKKMATGRFNLPISIATAPPLFFFFSFFSRLVTLIKILPIAAEPADCREVNLGGGETPSVSSD